MNFEKPLYEFYSSKLEKIIINIKDGSIAHHLIDIVSYSHLVKILEYLVKEGIITRNCELGDNRSKIIYLTEKGKNLQKRLLQVREIMIN